VKRPFFPGAALTKECSPYKGPLRAKGTYRGMLSKVRGGGGGEGGGDEEGEETRQ